MYKNLTYKTGGKKSIPLNIIRYKTRFYVYIILVDFFKFYPNLNGGSLLKIKVIRQFSKFQRTYLYPSGTFYEQFRHNICSLTFRNYTITRKKQYLYTQYT